MPRPDLASLTPAESDCPAMAPGAMVGEHDIGKGHMAALEKSPKPTAYHEAGHAVIGREMHLRVTSCSIIPEGDTLGCCRFDIRWKDFHPDSDMSSKVRYRLERDIIATLAGPEAEAIHHGSHEWLPGHEGDTRHAIDLAGYVTGDVEETGAYLDWLTIRTRSMLGQPILWAAVHALALELLAQGELGTRSIREIMNDATQSWLDRRRDKGGVFAP